MPTKDPIAEDVKCSASVDEGGFHRRRCALNAKVEVKGRWYCGIHDPNAIAKKRAERHAQVNAEWDAREKGYAIGKARAVICDAGLRVSKGRSLLGTLGFSELLDGLDAAVDTLRKIERGE